MSNIIFFLIVAGLLYAVYSILRKKDKVELSYLYEEIQIKSYELEGCRAELRELKMEISILREESEELLIKMKKIQAEK